MLIGEKKKFYKAYGESSCFCLLVFLIECYDSTYQMSGQLLWRLKI